MKLDLHFLQATVTLGIVLSIAAFATASDFSKGYEYYDSHGVLAELTESGTPPEYVTKVDTIIGLTILLQFPDDSIIHDRSLYFEMMNGEDFHEQGNYGSVFSYFDALSNGRTFYKNIVTRVFTTSQSKKYYKPREEYTRIQGEIKKVLDTLEMEEFDFLQLSTKNNYVRALNVLFAGEPSHDADYPLWPHSSGFTKETDKNGVLFKSYQLTDIDSVLRPGVVIHENGHMVFDWPDLYGGNGSANGVGQFDIMCKGNDSIFQFTNPYFRFTEGWLDTIDISHAEPGSEFVLRPGDQTVYIYRKSHFYPDQPEEYFVIELKQKEGWNSLIPDEGLAIWHVESPTVVKLEEADGLNEMRSNTNFGGEGDLFHTGGEFSATTTPGSRWKSKQQSYFRVYDIQEETDGIYFKTGMDRSNEQGGQLELYRDGLKVPKRSYSGSQFSSDDELNLVSEMDSVTFILSELFVGLDISEIPYLQFYKESPVDMKVSVKTEVGQNDFYIFPGSGLVQIDLTSGANKGHQYIKEITFSIPKTYTMPDSLFTMVLNDVVLSETAITNDIPVYRPHFRPAEILTEPFEIAVDSVERHFDISNMRDALFTDSTVVGYQQSESWGGVNMSVYLDDFSGTPYECRGEYDVTQVPYLTFSALGIADSLKIVFTFNGATEPIAWYNIPLVLDSTWQRVSLDLRELGEVNIHELTRVSLSWKSRGVVAGVSNIQFDSIPYADIIEFEYLPISRRTNTTLSSADTYYTGYVGEPGAMDFSNPDISSSSDKYAQPHMSSSSQFMVDLNVPNQQQLNTSYILLLPGQQLILPEGARAFEVFTLSGKRLAHLPHVRTEVVIVRPL